MSLKQLKNRILNKDSGIQNLIFLARELHCLPELIGRDYEVYDNQGKLKYKVRQKAMPLVTLNLLSKELSRLLKREAKQMNKGRRR